MVTGTVVVATVIGTVDEDAAGVVELGGEVAEVGLRLVGDVNLGNDDDVTGNSARLDEVTPRDFAVVSTAEVGATNDVSVERVSVAACMADSGVSRFGVLPARRTPGASGIAITATAHIATAPVDATTIAGHRSQRVGAGTPNPDACRVRPRQLRSASHALTRRR